MTARRIFSYGIAALCAASCGGNSVGASRTDRGQAERINLQLSDFPSAWRSSGASRGSDPAVAFRHCLDVENFHATHRARSDTFADMDSIEASSASSETAVFESDEQARRVFKSYAAGVRGSRGERCSLDYVRQLLDERYRAVTTEYASVVPLSGLTPAEEEQFGKASFSPPPNLEEAGAWEIAVAFRVCCGEAQPPTLDEDPPTAYVDIVQLRKGDTLSYLQTLNVSRPLPLRDDLVAAVALRMTP